MEDAKKMTELRSQIDQTDAEIVDLLNKRAQLALQVRIAKGGTNVYRPEREAEVIRNILAENRGPLSNEALETLFKSIIYVCRAIQQVEIHTDDNR